MKVLNFTFFILFIIGCNNTAGPKFTFYEKDGELWREAKIYNYPKGKKTLIKINQYKEGNNGRSTLQESLVFYEVWPNGEYKFISKDGYLKYKDGKSQVHLSAENVPDNIILETYDENGESIIYYFKDGKKEIYTLGKRDGTTITKYSGEKPGLYRWENGEEVFIRELSESEIKFKEAFEEKERNRLEKK